MGSMEKEGRNSEEEDAENKHHGKRAPQNTSTTETKII